MVAKSSDKGNLAGVVDGAGVDEVVERNAAGQAGAWLPLRATSVRLPETSDQTLLSLLLFTPLPERREANIIWPASLSPAGAI